MERKVFVVARDLKTGESTGGGEEVGVIPLPQLE